MRLSRRSALLTALVVVVFGLTTLGRQSQKNSVGQDTSADAAAPAPKKQVIRPSARPPAPAAADSVFRFQDSATLKLSLEQLRSGPGVLLRNPEGQRRAVRLTVVDSLESMPLSRVLIVDTGVVPVRRGTRAQPGMALLKLSAAPDAERLPPGDYFGYLVAESRDSVPQARRLVQVGVPQSAGMKAVNSAWTAEVFKLSLSPRLRAFASENSELRCGADRRPAGDGIIPHRMHYVLGTCVRDNQLPVTITGPWVARSDPDSAARTRGEKLQKLAELGASRPRDRREPRDTAAPPAAQASARSDSAQTRPRRQSVIASLLPARPMRKDTLPPPRVLLGVLQHKDSVDRAMVWWTGTPVSSGEPGSPAGLELHFTSLDRPGEYRGTVDLAPIGGTGTVQLRVRVTHDWPLVLLAIGLGVWLSWWLRNYLRTRRAVLQMQAAAAELVSRIGEANTQLRQVDSDEAGYLEYPVDESLLTRLRALERELQQHVYDATVLEPGKPEHDTLRQQLNTCEQEVLVWEALAGVLAELRVELLTAAELEAQLRPGEFAVLLARVETVFDGKRLPTAEIPPLTARARGELDAVRCWNEVAQNASELKKTLDAAAPDEEGREKAAAALEAALVELWGSPDAEAAKRAGPKVAAAGKLYRPRKFKLPVSIFGGMTAAAPAASPVRAPQAPAPAPPGNESAMSGPGRVPVEGGTAATDKEIAALEAQARARAQLRARNHEALRKQLARRTEDWQNAQDHRNKTEALRKSSERRYYWLTVAVAAATGLNQLYFKDGGFGDLQDYMVALLWGFGTKMGLDTVRTAVEGGRIPFLRDGASAPAQQAGGQAAGNQQSGGQAAGNQQAANQPGANQQQANQSPVGAGAGAGAGNQTPPPENPDGSSG